MEKPGEGGERWGNQGFFPVSAAFELPARHLGGDDTRVQHLYVSAGSSAPRPVSTSQVPAGG